MAARLACLLLSLLPFFTFLPFSISTPTYLSFPLTNRDARTSLIRAPEADPSDLPQEMALKDIVAAGRAMKARESMRNRTRGKRHAPHLLKGSFSYLNVIVGDFYLLTSVGNPPQQLTFLLDTGSELTFTKCKPCLKCNKTEAPLFEFSKSSSYTQVSCNSPLCIQSLGFTRNACGGNVSSGNCSFTLQYGDGSMDAGYISVDSFHLSKEVLKAIVFGCAVVDIDTVGDPSSGVMGLNAGPFSFPSQVLGGSSKLANKFAYCLPDRFKNLNSLGTIVFGDYTHPSKLSYTPLVPPYGPLAHLYYFVKLEGISVGGKFIKSILKQEGTNVVGTIFDSGTALSHLVEPLLSNLVEEMRNQTAHLHPFSMKDFASDVCYKVPLDLTELPKVPLVIMHFAGGMKLELGPESLLYPNGNDNKHAFMCLAFAEALSGSPLNIIGNHQQQNYWVEYNLNAFKIGIAKAACGKK
ncbi:hypothetical protein GOP47_0026936 [Adiantum capillus-veneris]|nr:hypothetical protein GOP47_0026936 [Adiantum capillus-veneris]